MSESDETKLALLELRVSQLERNFRKLGAVATGLVLAIIPVLVAFLLQLHSTGVKP